MLINLVSGGVKKKKATQSSWKNKMKQRRARAGRKKMKNLLRKSENWRHTGKSKVQNEKKKKKKQYKPEIPAP